MHDNRQEQGRQQYARQRYVFLFLFCTTCSREDLAQRIVSKQQVSREGRWTTSAPAVTLAVQCSTRTPMAVERARLHDQGRSLAAIYMRKYIWRQRGSIDDLLTLPSLYLIICLCRTLWHAHGQLVAICTPGPGTPVPTSTDLQCSQW